MRANPDQWEERDTRTSWIVNRGYTGHEHLDVFGVINMNGRVYDPLTAVFMSPDAVISSPSDWLAYNRYTYCMNNPMKYTDPSGYVPYYIFPFVFVDVSGSYSPSGGVGFSASIGVGITTLGSAQITVGYSFGSNNFYVTAGVSLMCVTAYGGWSSKAGWMAGVSAGLSVDGFGSSLSSIGYSYSQKGQECLSAFGLNMTRYGNSFDPSVSWSANKVIYDFQDHIYSYDNIMGVSGIEDAEIKDNSELHKFVEGKYNKNEVDKVDMKGNEKNSNYKRDANGRLWDPNNKMVGGYCYTPAGVPGVRKSSIYLSPFSNKKYLAIAFDHELVHAHIGHIWGLERTLLNKFWTDDRDFASYSEYSASSHTKQYISDYPMPDYSGSIPAKFGWPNELMTPFELRWGSRIQN